MRKTDCRPYITILAGQMNDSQREHVASEFLRDVSTIYMAVK
jgi:hypothetical protein